MFKEKLFELQCKEFASDGYHFSLELLNDNKTITDQYQNQYSRFSIAQAIALTWTKHAKYENDFFDYALTFFDSNEDIDEHYSKLFSWRFGADALKQAMMGLRNFKNEIKNIIPDFNSCDAKALKIFQDKTLAILNDLIFKKTVTGVGPWLFLGPMKIILGTEDRLWDDPNIDSIILPTGIEVNRGILKLIKQSSPIVKDFDPNWIINEERSLLEGFSNDQLVHNVLQKIAGIADTRVIHINGAFYLYGRGS